MAEDRWTIGRKLYAGFGTLLLLTVIAGIVAIWGSSRIKGDVETVTQRSVELQRALSIQTALYKIESAEKTILWAGVDNDRPLYDSSKRAVLEQHGVAQKDIDALASSLTDQNDVAAARVISHAPCWLTAVTRWRYS